MDTKKRQQNEAYFHEVFEKPWGCMFYDLLFPQLLENLGGKTLLDFGSGYGRTAKFLSENGFDVTAYEPDQDKLSRLSHQPYTQLSGDLSALTGHLAGHQFDAIIIHNVLEYVGELTEKAEVLHFLAEHLRAGGLLSIVKHTKNGTIMRRAVNMDNPLEALQVLHDKAVSSVNHGLLQLYDDDWLTERLSVDGLTLQADKSRGMRMFYGLGQNNEMKESEAWYASMLQLEQEAGKIPEFYNIAMFHHLIFRKEEK